MDKITVEQKTKEYIRRSISIPNELNNRIDEMISQYSYTYKNDLIIELLELGLLKFNEDLELKQFMINLLLRVNNLIQLLEKNNV